MDELSDWLRAWLESLRSITGGGSRAVGAGGGAPVATEEEEEEEAPRWNSSIPKSIPLSLSNAPRSTGTEP